MVCWIADPGPISTFDGVQDVRSRLPGQDTGSNNVWPVMLGNLLVEREESIALPAQGMNHPDSSYSLPGIINLV